MLKNNDTITIVDRDTTSTVNCHKKNIPQVDHSTQTVGEKKANQRASGGKSEGTKPYSEA